MNASGEVRGRAGLGLALGGVLAVMLTLLPDRDPSGPPGPPAPAASDGPGGVLPTATPAVPPSEEAFCRAYGDLAATQGSYLAQPDQAGADLLRAALDDILAVGIPESMGTLARTGYFVDLSGLYADLGEVLDPRAVPGAAPDDPALSGGTSLTGAPGAFGDWLVDLCPGW